MCRPEMALDIPISVEEARRQQQLVELVGKIERAAQEMFHAAGESSDSPKGSPSNSPPGGGEDTKLPPEMHGISLEPDPINDMALYEHNSGSGNDSEENTRATPRKRKRNNRARSPKDPNATEKGHKRSYVEHRYHDHSQDLPGTQDASAQAPTKSRGGITTPFPMQLHDMLQLADSRGYRNVVSWQPHGRAFHVHDPTRFVAEVMPMFFRQTRMSSFQRQLSLYGFLRLTRKGPDHGAYYHELFLRGMPHLCRRMQRTRIKGYWVRQSSSPETEPDFSSMPVVGQSKTITTAESNPAAFSGLAAAAFAANQPPQAAAVVQAPDPPPSLFWQPDPRGAASANGNKVESSLQIESTLGSGFDLPNGEPYLHSLAQNDGVAVPPMPPLDLALEADIAAFGSSAPRPEEDTKQPAAARMTAQAMMANALPVPGVLHQNQLAHSQVATEQHSRASEQAASLLYDKQLEQHFMDMSSKERNDMAAFLSDVDLTSGDENSEEEGYEEEAKIGSVYSTRRKRARRMEGV